jgi:hypothetical protein
VTSVAPSSSVVGGNGDWSGSVSANKSGLKAAPHRPRVKVMERVIGANIAADSLSSMEKFRLFKDEGGQRDLVINENNCYLWVGGEQSDWAMEQ